MHTTTVQDNTTCIHTYNNDYASKTNLHDASYFCTRQAIRSTVHLICLHMLISHVTFVHMLINHVVSANTIVLFFGFFFFLFFLCCGSIPDNFKRFKQYGVPVYYALINWLHFGTTFHIKIQEVHLIYISPCEKANVPLHMI